jgi:hypothetical protein
VAFTCPNQNGAVADARIGSPDNFVPAHRVDNNRAKMEEAMGDVLMLAITSGLFVTAVGYAFACERL